MNTLEVLLIILFLVLPFAVLIYDWVKYKKWYTRKPKLIFLRLNTSEVRKKIETEGIKLCRCCIFKGNVWLSPDREGVVHGMGLPYEGMEDLSAKEICAFDIQSAKDKGELIVDCGTDIKKFIKEVKNYGGL